MEWEVHSSDRDWGFDDKEAIFFFAGCVEWRLLTVISSFCPGHYSSAGWLEKKGWTDSWLNELDNEWARKVRKLTFFLDNSCCIKLFQISTESYHLKFSNSYKI